MLVGVEVEEQLVGLVDDLGDAGVRPVDLVDHEDDRHLRLERLAQHEPGLRQRALGRVDEQQHAVDHRQPALDLATEVGVAGRVDDVDRHALAVGHHVIDGGVLREDRDALLTLQVVGVHDALVDVAGVGLVRAERARLPQHGVDERGLAVVDVRDDRDVAQVSRVLCSCVVTSIRQESCAARASFAVLGTGVEAVTAGSRVRAPGRPRPVRARSRGARAARSAPHWACGRR